MVIVGDIGHYNDDNLYLIEQLSKHYEKIFITWENHDLYLLSSQHREKYNYNSFNRLNEFKEMVKSIKNVVFLDGQKVEYKSKIFWGSGLWYKVNNLKHWTSYMHDARYLYDKKEGYKIVLPYDYYPVTFDFDTSRLHEKEFEKIKNLDYADIIISHVPPLNVTKIDEFRDNYYFVSYE